MCSHNPRQVGKLGKLSNLAPIPIIRIIVTVTISDYMEKIMNIIDQENIRTMRTKGCSYKQIADTLNIKKCTVKKHCLRHDIKLPDTFEATRKPIAKWVVCPHCKKVFIADTENEKQFCSDKCRSNYWRTERKKEKIRREEEEAMRREFEHLEALKKELDLSAKQSNELVDGKKLVLGYRKE